MLDIGFDGDVTSFTAVYTEDAIKEVKKVLASRNYYVGASGEMTYSVIDNVTKLVLANITG